jgi:hypothetical protein
MVKALVGRRQDANRRTQLHESPPNAARLAVELVDELVTCRGKDIQQADDRGTDHWCQVIDFAKTEPARA